MTNTTEDVKTQDLVVKRIIDAPLELVWKAWTEPEHVRRWWGPKDYASPRCELELREGGKFLFAMRAPQEQGGQVSYTAGVYHKIVPLARLEFTQTLADADGHPMDPAELGMPPDFPREIRMVVTFKARRDMTELTVTANDWPVSTMFVYALAGWNQSIDRLAESVQEN